MSLPHARAAGMLMELAISKHSIYKKNLRRLLDVFHNNPTTLSALGITDAAVKVTDAAVKVSTASLLLMWPYRLWSGTRQ